MDFQSKLFHTRRIVHEFFEDQWFDRTRRVRTAGDVSLRKAGISKQDAPDSEWYVPARPAHIREALGAAPVGDAARYTYIDLGSGKGRTLFIAAEHGFGTLLGVELSDKLHGVARANIQSFKPRKPHRGRLEMLHQNAAEFRFPESPLVLYMFNPFGEATMQQVLDNLQASLEKQPRHTVVILLWPRHSGQVARVPGMRKVRSTTRYDIFEAHADLEPFA